MNHSTKTIALQSLRNKLNSLEQEIDATKYAINYYFKVADKETKEGPKYFKFLNKSRTYLRQAKAAKAKIVAAITAIKQQMTNEELKVHAMKEIFV